jgi:predicted DNA-binding transcriptional regulator AlpA
MTLLTRAFILERFGVRLTMGQLASLLAMSEGTIRNQVSAETFPIPTYKEGAARYAAYDAVADYLDAMSERARARAA